MRKKVKLDPCPFDRYLPDFSNATWQQGIVVGELAKHNNPKPIDIRVKQVNGKYWVWHWGDKQWVRCWL